MVASRCGIGSSGYIDLYRRPQENRASVLSFAQRRCLVPAPAYYEWRDDPDGKTPFAVARVDDDPVVFAGIWQDWRSAAGEDFHTFATITTDANPQVSAVQPRMPVILERSDWPVWLGEVEGDLPALLRPLPEGALRLWPIDKRVDQVRNDGPDLLESLPHPDHPPEPILL